MKKAFTIAVFVWAALMTVRTFMLQTRITRLERWVIQHDQVEAQIITDYNQRIEDALKMSTDAYHTALNKKLTPAIRKSKP